MRQTEVPSLRIREVTGADLFALFGSTVGVVGILYFIVRYLDLNPAAPEEIRQKISQVLRLADQTQKPSDGRSVFEQSTSNYNTLVLGETRSLYERSRANYRALVAKLSSAKF